MLGFRFDQISKASAKPLQSGDQSGRRVASTKDGTDCLAKHTRAGDSCWCYSTIRGPYSTLFAQHVFHLASTAGHWGLNREGIGTPFFNTLQCVVVMRSGSRLFQFANVKFHDT